MTKIAVLDQGWIELRDPQPVSYDGDNSIVAAARVSYQGESKGEIADKALLAYMLNHKPPHTSPFEHVQFHFRVRAPIIVWWHWIRHRTQSYNGQSGRFTEFNGDDFYIPQIWRLQSETNKQGSAGALDARNSQRLTEAMFGHCAASYEMYQGAIRLGVAREQARLFLPAFTLYYTFVDSVNAKNLMDFLSQRMAGDAQWEIRQYANVIFSIFREQLPWTAEAFENFVLDTAKNKP